MLRVRQIATALWMLLVAIVAAPFSIFSRAAARFFMAYAWAPGLLWTSGVRVRTQMDPAGLPEGPTVLVSNHGSLLDIPILCRAFGWAPRFIAKLELGRLPVLAFYMRRSGAVLIDRKRAREAVRVLDEVVELLPRGNPVCFFAEGGRSRDGRVHRFRNGAFQVAQRAGAPVVPVAIVGSGDALPSGSLMPRPGEVRVAVGAPLQPLADEPPAEFAARARAAVGALHVGLGGAGLAGDPEADPGAGDGGDRGEPG